MEFCNKGMVRADRDPLPPQFWSKSIFLHFYFFGPFPNAVITFSIFSQTHVTLKAASSMGPSLKRSLSSVVLTGWFPVRETGSKVA